MGALNSRRTRAGSSSRLRSLGLASCGPPDSTSRQQTPPPSPSVDDGNEGDHHGPDLSPRLIPSARPSPGVTRAVRFTSFADLTAFHRRNLSGCSLPQSATTAPTGMRRSISARARSTVASPSSTAELFHRSSSRTDAAGRRVPGGMAKGQARGQKVEIEGRELTLSNLDKVLYPAAGFRKADVIDYYRQIAPLDASPSRAAARRPSFGHRTVRTGPGSSRRTARRIIRGGSTRAPGNEATGGTRGCLRRRASDAGVARQPGRPRAAHAPVDARRSRAPDRDGDRPRPGPARVDRRLLSRRARAARHVGAARPAVRRQDLGRQGTAPVGTGQRLGCHRRRDEAVRARARAAARVARPRPGARRHDAQQARRQGLRRLESERPAQDDRLPRTRCGSATAQRCRLPSPGRRSRVRSTPDDEERAHVRSGRGTRARGANTATSTPTP